MTDIHIYSVGVIYCSVCAPKEMPLAEVTAALNLEQPTGISSQWELDSAGVFQQGGPNPGPCERNPERTHYLFSC